MYKNGFAGGWPQSKHATLMGQVQEALFSESPRAVPEASRARCQAAPERTKNVKEGATMWDSLFVITLWTLAVWLLTDADV